ncbi:hypothetical protein FIBSPDRAFT_58652 [Athelia psychrophila]|nr:hypothetical protein FIBSPDRAFT_58652 [Fibularhizoctonia sp. CBS 109695]
MPHPIICNCKTASLQMLRATARRRRAIKLTVLSFVPLVGLRVTGDCQCQARISKALLGSNSAGYRHWPWGGVTITMVGLHPYRYRRGFGCIDSIERWTTQIQRCLQMMVHA